MQTANIYTIAISAAAALFYCSQRKVRLIALLKDTVTVIVKERESS